MHGDCPACSVGKWFTTVNGDAVLYRSSLKCLGDCSAAIEPEKSRELLRQGLIGLTDNLDGHREWHEPATENKAWLHADFLRLSTNSRRLARRKNRRLKSIHFAGWPLMICRNRCPHHTIDNNLDLNRRRAAMILCPSSDLHAVLAHKNNLLKLTFILRGREAHGWQSYFLTRLTIAPCD